MAKVKDGFLHLTPSEQPRWWQAKQYVKLVAETPKDMFLWAKEKYGKGCFQIDKNLNMPVEIRDGEYFIKTHTDLSIRLLSKKDKEAKENIEDLQDEFGDLDNKGFAKLYKIMIGKLLRGQIDAQTFKPAADSIYRLLQDWDLFSGTDSEKMPEIDIEGKLKEIMHDPKSSGAEKLRSIQIHLANMSDKNKKQERKTIILEVENEKV